MWRALPCGHPPHRLVAAGAVVNGVPMPVTKHAKSTSLPLECPLHSAARHTPEVAAPLIRLLVRATADPNRADQFAQTPLHVAACYSAPNGEPSADDAVLELLQSGASPHARDNAARTPRELASAGTAIHTALYERESRGAR